MKERLQAFRWHLSSINSIFTLSLTPFQLYSYFPLSLRERPDPCRWKLHPSESQIFELQKLNVTHSKSHSKCNENSTQSRFFTLQDVPCCGCRKFHKHTRFPLLNPHDKSQSSLGSHARRCDEHFKIFQQFLNRLRVLLSHEWLQLINSWKCELHEMLLH